MVLLMKLFPCARYVRRLLACAVKPAKTRDHLERIHPDKKNIDLEKFKILRLILKAHPT